MTNKIIINNWTGGGTLQTWTDGEWQILYAKDSAENCVTLSLNSGDAIRLAYAVSPTPSEIFERMRAANEAVYEMSYPEARADELRHIADEIDCGGICEECSQQKLDRGEFCGFVAADNMRKLATALELKSKIDASRPDAAALSQPAPVAANASAEARLREALDWIDAEAPATKPSDTFTQTVFRRGSDAYGEDHDVLNDIFAEGTIYGLWLAAEKAREALSAHPHASDCKRVTAPVDVRETAEVSASVHSVDETSQSEGSGRGLITPSSGGSSPPQEATQASDCDKQGETGMNWQVSDETLRHIEEINANRRNAAINADDIVAGSPSDRTADVTGTPFVSGCCEGERCFCGRPAEHKVEETIFYDDPKPIRHPLTRYICHLHFVDIMGPAANRGIARP